MARAPHPAGLNTQALALLRASRHQVYLQFACRHDTLVELRDAILTVPSIEASAHLRQIPSCQRGWGSLYDALNAVTMNWEQLELSGPSPPLQLQARPPGVRSTRVSGPAATPHTSPAQGYYPHPYRHSHSQPIVAGWNSSWLVQLPSRQLR